MTVDQFHREFKITFDKVDSEAYPEFLPAEIDYYLNEAQDRFIKQRYGINNIHRVGFEQIQKRTDDLKAIVKTQFTEVTPVPYYQSTGLNVYRANLGVLFTDSDRTTPSTDEYMLYVKGRTESCVADCCNWTKVKLNQQDDITVVAEDPFNRPSRTKPVAFFEDGDLYVWGGEGVVINNFSVTFIKRPVQLNLGTYGDPVAQCELSEYTHREILQMSVSIALENIESPRQQSQEIINVQKVE